ncbi:Asp23/Gls24 family envelope stress response protein [Pseudonocardia phyllosphaerae]|uniref:Asp23/Gls24 family envelope stress response protein n=1 Tax=Pseudonocardia phyllosphaerae TaxID=3390502 RepID=UPI00397B00F1
MTDDQHEQPRPRETLTCGASAEELMAQVADGRAAERDEHQRSCVHCRAFLTEYDRLWSPLRELAAQPVAVPDGPVEAALARIRGALGDPGYAVLEQGGQGLTRVAARVVVVTARYSAQQVPGVRVALSREVAAEDTGQDTGSQVVAGVAGASAAVEITLAADYGRSLPELAEQVRRTVTERICRLVDLEALEVTVVIDDVFR